MCAWSHNLSPIWGGHPQLRRVLPAALEGIRAEAATPEAVAKFFAALRWVCREFGITRAAQVWNTDESMMNAEELMEGAVSAVVTDDPSARVEYVIPSVQNGSEAASLVATVCADGSRLPLFVVVSGSGGRFPCADIAQEDGSTRRKLLEGYIDEGAEVHRREKSGFDGPLWEVFACFAARHLGKRCLTEWKVLPMNWCRVHASPVGLRVLKAPKVVVLMFPSHLSHILQALHNKPFLKTKSNARSGMRALLPTVLRGPRSTRFTLRASSVELLSPASPPSTSSRASRIRGPGRCKGGSAYNHDVRSAGPDNTCSAVIEGNPITLGSFVESLGWTVCSWHHRDQRSEMILMVGKEPIRPLSARAANCIFFELGSSDVISFA